MTITLSPGEMENGFRLHSWSYCAFNKIIYVYFYVKIQHVFFLDFNPHRIYHPVSWQSRTVLRSGIHMICVHGCRRTFDQCFTH